MLAPSLAKDMLIASPRPLEIVSRGSLHIKSDKASHIRLSMCDVYRQETAAYAEPPVTSTFLPFKSYGIVIRHSNDVSTGQ